MASVNMGRWDKVARIIYSPLKEFHHFLPVLLHKLLQGSSTHSLLHLLETYIPGAEVLRDS